MDAQTISVLGLAVAVAGHAVVFLFKSPKEYHVDLERRVTDLEVRQTNLSIRVEGVQGKHETALANLTKSIDRLTDRFDAYMGRRDGAGARGTS